MTSLLILPSVLVASAAFKTGMLLRHNACPSFESCPGMLILNLNMSNHGDISLFLDLSGPQFSHGTCLIMNLVPHRSIATNGPAIWGGCVTRRSIRQLSWYPAPAGPENCHGARRVWRTFCRHGTNFIECWRDRGTSMIGAANLSPVTKSVTCTGAVSGYNLSRSQKAVKVQKT